MAVKDGDKVELILRDGADGERTVKGTVRVFDHVDRVLDAEGYAVDKIVTKRYEVLTGDPKYPAIGFDPKTAKFKD